MVLATAGATRVPGAHTATETNVGQAERVLSVVAGGALAVMGLRRRDVPGIALALLGAELVHRGTTGHCMLYDALGVSSTSDTGTLALPRHRDDLTGRAATVNARRAIKIERSVVVHRSREDLYTFWRDFSNLPRFMHHLESVTCQDDRRSHWIAKAPGGKIVQWDAEIVNDIPDSLIAWKTVGDPDVAHAGSVHFRPAEDGRATEVRIVLDYEPPAASMVTLVARVFGHVPDTLIVEELDRFKRHMEVGG